MCNAAVSQEQNASGWKIFLEQAERMLTEAKSKKRRKELRYSVHAFETLIQQNAPMPRDVRNG
jgi:hypothetical protein